MKDARNYHASTKSCGMIVGPVIYKDTLEATIATFVCPPLAPRVMYSQALRSAIVYRSVLRYPIHEIFYRHYTATH